MEIIYGKQLTLEQNALCQQIAVECGILFDTARLLLYRGIDSIEKAKAFLTPSKFRLHNPLLLSGMKQAVERISLAKQRGESVLIFGDYDADGICATAILFYCLKDFGITATTVVPEREEGYGLNVEKIIALNQQNKIDLIITVDCGISDGEKIAKINELGIDVIVTDHHEPPQETLSCIAINPKLANQEYSFNGLCGAGVAYKLGRALIGEKADEYLDLTAIATVADSMDLIDENRDIVVEGLKLLNSKNRRAQLEQILTENSAKVVTAQTLAYALAPRINAGGRMGDANLALKLFLSQKQSEIFDCSAKLSEYNIARQVECDKIYKQAKAIISEQGLEKDQVILVAGDGWQAGFIGIVAAKLVEDYSRPVIVFADQDGSLKGSARSVEQVNIYDAISYAKELLIGYGGHSQAAGLSVEKANFELLRQKLNEFVDKTCGVLDVHKKIFAEWNIEGEFSLQFAKEIEMLEPFGVGNRRPLFTTDVKSAVSQPLKFGSAHYSYKTGAIEILDFNGACNVLTLSLPVNKKVLFEVNLSSFRNKLSLKGYSRALVADYGDYSELKPFAFACALENIVDGKQVNLRGIDRESLLDYKKIGTLFVISDPENIKIYPELSDLDVSLFTIDNKSSLPCIVISPKVVPEGYKRVVYLDKPMTEISTSLPKFIVGEELGYKIVDTLSVERAVFTDYFVKLKTLVGKTYFSLAQFCIENCGDNELYQFIFAVAVFIELNIFEVKNSRLVFNGNVKNPLTNSKVYSTINLLKN